MMTVRDHMKAAGYDPAAAWNQNELSGHRGMMECDSIKLRTFRCVPECFTEMIGVEAVAIVPFSDGYDHPYPAGWPKSLEASLTLYFPVRKESAK